MCISAVGNTISKCCNHLQADIVEALQFLKYLYRTDLFFQEQETMMIDSGDEEEKEEGFIKGVTRIPIVDFELASDIPLPKAQA